MLANVLSRSTFDNALAPLGERVASVASRVRGSSEITIVKNYAGRHTKLLLALATLVLWTLPAGAQRDVGYDNVAVPQNRIDARDLGYAPLDVIPDGESAITSLAVAPNGILYGATSGRRSHLFVFNPRHGYVQPLGVLPATTAVTHAVVVSAEGDVYIGSSPAGHLLEYTPPTDQDHLPINIGRPCRVADLGQAVPGESIFALTVDRKSEMIYGLTSPSAHEFAYSIPQHSFRDLGVVARHRPEGEKFETAKMMSRMLVVDDSGNLYSSGERGMLYELDKATQKLSPVGVSAPAIPGREGWTRVDAFLLARSGMIFGATSDGYLFRFDPKTRTMRNLGKPLIQYGIAGLVEAPSGKIYGIGGPKEGMARMFSYDPATGAYQVLGFVDVNRRPYYTWQAYVVRAMTSGLDGTVYIGESERMSKLYLFYPL